MFGKKDSATQGPIDLKDDLRNALLEAQFETTIDGILVVDTKGKTLAYNKNFGRLWNLPKNVLETGDEKQLLNIVTDLLVEPASFIAKVKYLYDHPDEQSVDQLTFKDGRVFDRYSAPIYDREKKFLGRIWYFRDATERVKAEVQAVINEKKFQTFFDNAGDAIFIHAQSPDIYNRKFIEVNQAACDKLGYRREELLAKSPCDLEIQPPNADMEKIVEKRTEQLRQTGMLVFQTDMRTKSGQAVPFEFNSRPAEFNRQKVLVSIARDISERVKVVELQELNRLKDDFLNITTHELRTPLTSIIGLSEVIRAQSTALSPDERKYIDIIHEEGERLARTIKQILEVTRYENRRVIMNMKPAKLDEFVAGLQPILESIAHFRDATIKFEIHTIAQTINTDREKVSQVIYDLVDNAIKFGPPKQTIKIFVSRPNEREILFEVVDEGPGIPKEKSMVLFTKFGQLDTSLARSQEGIGLGLYTAKMIITELGGMIGVTSQPGFGARFWFTLPAK